MPSTVLAAARVIQIPVPGRDRSAAEPDWPAAELLPEPLPAPPPGTLPGPEAIGGPEGTLLAVVPIPGTDTSLAIVGYTVPTVPGETMTEPVSPLQPAEGLVVDHARRCVWLSGKEVELTYQEFELLAFLSAHPDQVVSRADLLARVWGQLPQSSSKSSSKSGSRASTRTRTRTVDVHVSRLRRKLGAVYGQCLTTEYRVGYRFTPGISKPA
jgi:DNA-binding winged helix-turn-helix (wHTH) protein